MRYYKEQSPPRENPINHKIEKMKKTIITLCLLLSIIGCTESENLNFDSECELVEVFFQHIKNHDEENYDQIFEDFFITNELHSDTSYVRLYTNQFDHYKTLDISDYQCLVQDSNKTYIEYGKPSSYHKFKLRKVNGFFKIESCITISKRQGELGEPAFI